MSTYMNYYTSAEIKFENPPAPYLDMPPIDFKDILQADLRGTGLYLYSTALSEAVIYNVGTPANEHVANIRLARSYSRETNIATLALGGNGLDINDITLVVGALVPLLGTGNHYSIPMNMQRNITYFESPLKRPEVRYIKQAGREKLIGRHFIDANGKVKSEFYL